MTVEVLSHYYSQSVVDSIVDILGFFPFGVLLAVLGWVLTYTVHAVLRFIRSSS